jgi:hypothetical protein
MPSKNPLPKLIDKGLYQPGADERKRALSDDNPALPL